MAQSRKVQREFRYSHEEPTRRTSWTSPAGEDLYMAIGKFQDSCVESGADRFSRSRIKHEQTAINGFSCSWCSGSWQM